MILVGLRFGRDSAVCDLLALVSCLLFAVMRIREGFGLGVKKSAMLIMGLCAQSGVTCGGSESANGGLILETE